ncbi:hypothetical protein BCV69DRAFT_281182 [Microstroma glucosiphilum]|uniref:Proteasome assembly chaperone 3 n=1 Tax=Pseudomicrostroma glucosiphilum TaxID=1684307 RepID=A0A316UAA6_9BASI|nr:hypothetical protein BCV69DRAFT_281182 [Pseudomicrostroma glucosiphilum]PWN22177.1 hypothetical protein BCV69DRAFT_281182 [Pseudomicrostroma glucosiphilum]
MSSILDTMVMSAPRLAEASTSSVQQPTVTVQRLPSSSAYAVPTRQLAGEVEGKHTEVVIQEYHDRTFVVVTQLGRVGIVMQASLPADTPYIPYSSSSTSSTSNYDFDYPDSDSESEQRPNEHANGAAAAAGAPPTFTLPTINPSLVHTALLGTPPPGQAALYSLYVSSIHGLLRSSSTAGGGGEEDVKDLRPVVVGLGLGLGLGLGGQGEQEEEVDVMAEEERGRFVGVLELVRRCREVSSRAGEQHTT